MNVFVEKTREVLFSVLPVVIIVLLFHLTITPLGIPLFLKFILGSVLIILGLSFFLIGVDLAIAPLGSLTGSVITKTNKLWILILAGLVLGFFISIAEPGLIVLANQVGLVTSGQITHISLLAVVSVGIAIFLAGGFIRIVYNVPLYKVLTVLYGLTFILSLFTSREFLAIAFDASGATTGVLAVPFILSLAVGVSSLKKDSKASEKDSFGLVAIVSVGAIISVQIMSMLAKARVVEGIFDFTLGKSSGIIGAFFDIAPDVSREVFLALLPLLAIFFILQKLFFKLNKKLFAKVVKGFIYAFLGLVFFLVGVNGVFMEVGSVFGYTIALSNGKFLIIMIGFFLGSTTILAEPAVHVLTHQIEDVTSGYVKRKAVLFALSLGVGIAVSLSMVRILVPAFQLWHLLLPGYVVSIALTYFVPKLFVGIAFDAGGVATGPVTATFILAFTHGVAAAVDGASVLIDGFGMIATVALMPIITLQILGLIYQLKSKKGGLEPDAV